MISLTRSETRVKVFSYMHEPRVKRGSCGSGYRALTSDRLRLRCHLRGNRGEGALP